MRIPLRVTLTGTGELKTYTDSFSGNLSGLGSQLNELKIAAPFWVSPFTSPLWQVNGMASGHSREFVQARGMAARSQTPLLAAQSTDDSTGQLAESCEQVCRTFPTQKVPRVGQRTFPGQGSMQTGGSTVALQVPRTELAEHSSMESTRQPLPSWAQVINDPSLQRLPAWVHRSVP